MHDTKTYNLSMSINWIYDWDFFKIIERESKKFGLTSFIIQEDNLEDTYLKINDNLLSFNFLFDRASDSSIEFLKLQNILINKGTKIIERHEKIKWASDKATMHLEFISNGIDTPYTFILAPFEFDTNISITNNDLIKIGSPFIIKPANTTGGGVGVFDNAKDINDILLVRKEFEKDKYLIQEKVIPLEADGRYFWFRCFYGFGSIYCTWWNNNTKKYKLLSEEDLLKYSLQKLFTTVENIKKITDINFFSTEIAIDKNNKFLVVDYVNEVCDMRLQSKYYDGVPDVIVENIARNLILFLKDKINNNMSSV